MPRPLKVYGVLGWRVGCPAAPNGNRQTREVVAARSKAEAARLLGCSLHWLNSYGSETWNDRELVVAMASPGTVFWRPNHLSGAEYQPAGGKA